MNQSLPALFEVLRRTLREAVEPELSSDHARSQLAGALDILGKLEGMLAWSPDALREQLAILREHAVTFGERAASHGLTVDVAPPELAPVTSQRDLEQAVVAGEAHLRALVDWLFDHEPSLPPAAFAELDELQRGALRRLLVLERKIIPRADFGAMTAGASKARPPTGGT